MKKEVTCLNCGHSFVMTSFSCDDLGPHTTCPECDASFDIDIEDVLAYHQDFKKRKYEVCRTISPGEHFTYNGIEFVCLDVFDNKLLAITAEIIKSMEFNATYENGCNDWKNSKIRAWLNEEFIKHFNENDLILQKADLTADNGDDSYGVCDDDITLLSCNQYRKYRKFIPTYDDWVWTITPWSCSTDSVGHVRCVHPSGVLYINFTFYSYGLAPICLFNLEHLNFDTM